MHFQRMEVPFTKSTQFLAGLLGGCFILHLSCDSTKEVVLFFHFLVWPVSLMTTTTQNRSGLWLDFGSWHLNASKTTYTAARLTQFLTHGSCSTISMCWENKWTAKINMCFNNTWFLNLNLMSLNSVNLKIIRTVSWEIRFKEFQVETLRQSFSLEK